MNFNIPLYSGNSLSIDLDKHNRLFILGINGSGKSALLQRFISSNEASGRRIRRISAHRQTWLKSGNPTMTSDERKNAEFFLSPTPLPDRRWRDEGPDLKQKAVLSDLITKESNRARAIANRVDEKNIESALAKSAKTSPPIKELNELLSSGNLDVSIAPPSNNSEIEILAQHKNCPSQFSIAKMSDGERSAVLIAAEVLTIDQNSILLIDEPERHLYRSIIVPFLSALFAKRNDCTFIISTHEVALPLENAEAPCLILRSCKWDGENAISWDAEIIKESSELSEDIKCAILGSRKKIIFVEGTTESLDQSIYSTLFPNITIIPKRGCAEVKKVVKGMQEANEHHQAEAFGLIDRDNLSGDEVKQLSKDRIYTLPVCSVESIYYCSKAIEIVAKKQKELTGRDTQEMILECREKALKYLKDNEDISKKMAAKKCERGIRNLRLLEIPTWKEIIEDKIKDYSQSNAIIKSNYDEELERFNNLLQKKDLDGLIARYPLRESQVFCMISKSLEFLNKKKYEQALLTQLRNNPQLATDLKQFINIPMLI